MKKSHRLHIRTSQEIHEKLRLKANKSGTDNVSLEARLILEKSLGIKRANSRQPAH